LGLVYTIFEFAAPAEFLPVVRLHQRCVIGPQWYRVEEQQQIPPIPAQQTVLSTVQELVGMGRVNTWTDAGDEKDPCRARQDTALEEVEDYSNPHHYSSGFVHPFYFDFPVRNVGDGQIDDTSASWCRTHADNSDDDE